LILKSLRKTSSVTPLSQFELLVEQQYGKVFRFSLRLLNNSADAEDATQEAFLRAYKGLTRFKGDSSLATWMYRITYTTCMDMLRTKHRHQDSSWSKEDTDLWESLPDRSLTPEQIALIKEDRNRIKKALSLLSLEFRTVVVLREIEDLSYEDIARILDIPIGTVRSRLARGRRMLSELLYAENKACELTDYPSESGITTKKVGTDEL
jgi:RNA polymerase sigma-70 factor (ECF subfamily)